MLTASNFAQQLRTDTIRACDSTTSPHLPVLFPLETQRRQQEQGWGGGGQVYHRRDDYQKQTTVTKGEPGEGGTQ